MSFQAWTEDRITDLTNAYNALVASKQKINQLVEKTTYETGMYIAVYDPTQNPPKTVKFPFLETGLAGYATELYVNNQIDASASAYFIQISGNVFTLKKHPGNTSPISLEVNDMICGGWWGNTEFWRLAVYVGGAATAASSWNIIDSVEDIPLN